MPKPSCSLKETNTPAPAKADAKRLSETFPRNHHPVGNPESRGLVYYVFDVASDLPCLRSSRAGHLGSKVFRIEPERPDQLRGDTCWPRGDQRRASQSNASVGSRVLRFRIGSSRSERVVPPRGWKSRPSKHLLVVEIPSLRLRHMLFAPEGRAAHVRDGSTRRNSNAL